MALARARTRAGVSGPRGTWSGAAGRANVRTGEPMRPDARMRLESVSSVFLLPLFFAYTGLRTQIGLLDKAKLPVTGAEQAARLLDPTLPSNTLIPKA